MKPDLILDRTADKLESGEWQWYQYAPGKGMSDPGHYCVSEALWKMTMVDFSLDRETSSWSRWLEVLDAMRKQTGATSLAFWNDSRARTKEQVIGALRAAAQDVRDHQP